MKRIEIKASNNYDILIGHDILKDCGKFAAQVKAPCTACIITDNIVNGLYANTVESSLTEAGFNVIKYVFENGEQSKNIRTYTDILEHLASNQLTRHDLIIALGGGVVGDMAGFAAATYLRGLKVIQIPTTFLAAIDSSVGGKTAINLTAGKNLAGSFHQPSLVVCDLDTFKTLKDNTFADGCAEAIKYGIINDRELFDALLNTNIKENIEDVISRCIRIKRDLVMRDEFDNGDRQLLNLGHTFGHPIEKCSNFEITHGYAVGIGLVMAARVSKSMGILQEDFIEDLKKCLVRNDLLTATDISPLDLWDCALHDKKRNKDIIKFVLPVKIGECKLTPINVDNLESVFNIAVHEE